MGSNQNPLNTTKDYYPAVNNATRGNGSGGMFQSVQEMTEEPKPKNEFANYKDKPVNTSFLKVSNVGATVPKYQGILV